MIAKILFDALLINLSFVLAYYIRFKIFLFITPASLPIFEKYLNTLVFVTLLWLAVFKLAGLYEEKKFTALIDEIAALLWGVTLSSLVLLGLLFLYRELWFSRLVIVNAGWMAFISMALVRYLYFAVGRFRHKCGWGLRNILIIGEGEIGKALASKMQQDQGLGYRLRAVISDKEETPRIKELIRKEKVEEVFIASTAIPAEKILDIITECERLGVEFKIVPGILELIASRVDIDELAGVPLLTVSEIRLKGLNAAMKRSADMILSAGGVVLLSPLFLVFALLVKMTSKGPIFYGQERIGLDSKPFKMFKFRSMYEDADKLFPQLEKRSEVEGLIFKMKEDPRITPLGKFMRRASIDELPQLFNVFRGEMSLVGPRPPLPRETVKYNSWHKKRLRVRPGITGPWQVSGRSLLPFEDMVRLDIYYIENWSLWLDFKLLLRTIPVVLLGKGAY